MKVRIASGPNAGHQWSLPVSGRGIGAGTFESGKFEALSGLIREGDSFWDMGAHYGYASLIGARQVGAAGSVTSFEPSGMNRWFLAAHLRWNGYTDTEIIPCAVADVDGEERFGGRGGSIGFKLGQGDEVVEVRSLYSVLEERHTPTVIKIDVEGAESRVLDGAVRAFASLDPERELPLMMVAVHDETQFELCRTRLRELGYTTVAAAWFNRFLSGHEGWRGDPDLLAIPPHRVPELDDFRQLAWFADGPLV